MGTIIGVRKNVRNWLLNGILLSNSMASPNDSTTAKGTAITENFMVLYAACRNAALRNTLIKLSKNTKR